MKIRKFTVVLSLLLSVLILLLFTNPYLVFKTVRSVIFSGTDFTRVAVEDNRINTTPGGVSANELLAMTNERYRLSPDRRFIYAFEYLLKLLGKDGGNVKAEFRKNKWVVLDGGVELATLDEYPTFSSIMRSLRMMSSKLWYDNLTFNNNTKNNITFESIKGFDAAALIKRLDEGSRLWQQGLRSKSLVVNSTDLLVRLAMTADGTLAVDDMLQGRAIAMIALTQAVSSSGMLTQEMLAAYVMGYHAHSLSLSKRLPENDIWRLYVERDYKNIINNYAAEGVDEDEAFIVLSSFARLQEKERWTQWLLMHFNATGSPIYALKTSAYFNGHEPFRTVRRIIPHLTVMSLLNENKITSELIKTLYSDLGANDSSLALTFVLALYNEKIANKAKFIDEFESVLKRVSVEYSGPLLGHELHYNYHLGHFFGSLRSEGVYYLDTLSSNKAAIEFAEVLGESKGGLASELQVWYRSLVESNAGRVDLKKLATSVNELRYLGSTALIRTHKEQLRYYSVGTPSADKTIAELVSHLDTRVSHRYILAKLAWNNLYHLSLGEKIYDSIQRDEGLSINQTSAWLAMRKQDWDALEAMAHDATIHTNSRSIAVKYLQKSPASFEHLSSLYSRLRSEKPREWSPLSYYLEYLQENEKYAQVVSECDKWLVNATEEFDPFPYWKATIAKTSALLKLNEVDRAWATLEPILDSWFGPALSMAVRVNIADGNPVRAAEYVQRMLKRYSGTYSLSVLLYYFWSLGDYQQAAQSITNWPYKITQTDWRDIIAPVFVEVFADNAVEARKAFNSLLADNKFQKDVYSFMRVLSKKLDHKLLFDLFAAIPASGKNTILRDLRAYPYLKMEVGQEAALEWLDERISFMDRNYASITYMYERNYELLWELIPAPNKGPFPESVWLYRAVAEIEGYVSSPEQKKSLYEYYSSASDHKYDQLGRFVLGMSDGRELYDTKLNARTLSEVAFYLAVKEVSRGQYATASDWFRVSIETGDQTNGEYHWSLDRLTNWRNMERSLSELAASKARFKSG